MRWAAAAAGAVAVLGAAAIVISVALGARAARWETAVQVSALVVWVAYAVMMRFLYARLQVKAELSGTVTVDRQGQPAPSS